MDEASILYSKRDKSHPDYELALQARELTEEIVKLGRAAGIHMILATQKVSKETVDTLIQENISGHMSLKTNTLQGSVATIGTKDAKDLPDMPGRGIWNVGTRKTEVQVPLISEQEIESVCDEVSDALDAGEKENLSPMLGSEEKPNGLKFLMSQTNDKKETA